MFWIRIRNHARQLAEVEQLNILGLWTNFLIQSERRGLENCLPMVLAAYQTLMEQNMLYDAGSYSINFARNALAVAARLGELEWGWQFLDHAKGQFNETEAHKLYFYGAACLEHAAGNNSKAKKILAKGDFSDPFYKVAQALLLLRICFDTHEDDLFLSIHASIYRQMFRKEKVTSTYRQSIQNFLKLIKSLFDLRALAANAQQIAEWKVQYVGYPVIALREWLLARMAQLES